ncbi:Similar to Transposon TX1 uncharacterized 82 kDa protein (Xenopus laevis) [Cotesia congregata]|uniref:Similar to Transposon TX1 uncharacterized 82 kDa protein (Xenopus laevis) n=1 Tax=Cotesia congregata TaxID=51543 RepID=A0A8J2HCJ6_COTCN|nr:Similar to Transposon TX1 uncharacterized 82 kDa protein (Xenopus laevis) [Cotesia congregata]
MSAVTTLRARLSAPGLQHVMSFRRQVYIKPEDVEKIPSSWKIDFDDTTYWIYPTLDNIICFLCKQKGHLTKSCPTKTSETGETDENKANKTIIDIKKTQNPSDNSTRHPQVSNFPTLSAKRPLSTSSTENKLNTIEPTSSLIFQKPAPPIRTRTFKKSKKTDANPTVKEPTYLPTIETELLANPTKYQYNYVQICELLEKLNQKKTTRSSYQ